MLPLCSPCCCVCAWQAARAVSVVLPAVPVCVFKRRGLTFILVFLSKAMEGRRGGGETLVCGMKLGAVEGSLTAEREQTEDSAGCLTHIQKLHRIKELT
ncbi:hypothetical protein NQZ68_013286 [Dissostichus eleginoides]|nr:hypothetical protein NQZ68_013286 [Dissostichus eleginoides]